MLADINLTESGPMCLLMPVSAQSNLDSMLSWEICGKKGGNCAKMGETCTKSGSYDGGRCT